jgi:3',5'-cyclic-AMP phosphodiesterase
VRLNTQEARPVGLSTTQVDWFRDQADAALRSGERLVVFQHNYPYQIWETFDGPGIDAWREIMQTHRIDVLFSGHTHYLQTANDGRNVMVAVRSIGDPEGGRPGYLLAYLHGDDLAFRYRTIDDIGSIVLITHPRDRRTATGPAHVVAGPDRVRARIWSRDSLTHVERRIDDGPWQSMTPERDHDWTGNLPEGLAKGDHRLEVRAFAGDQRTGCDSIMFAFDPTRRFTAVPCAWPTVASTNFC